MSNIIDEVKTYDKEKLDEDIDNITKFGWEDKEADLDRYKEAFFIACQLMNGDVIYGIDEDKIFELVMDKYDMVSPFRYQQFILEHIDRFSDDDERREKAIKELGW